MTYDCGHGLDGHPKTFLRSVENLWNTVESSTEQKLENFSFKTNWASTPSLLPWDTPDPQ